VSGLGPQVPGGGGGRGKAFAWIREGDSCSLFRWSGGRLFGLWNGGAVAHAMEQGGYDRVHG